MQTDLVFLCYEDVEDNSEIDLPELSLEEKGLGDADIIETVIAGEAYYYCEYVSEESGSGRTYVRLIDEGAERLTPFKAETPKSIKKLRFWAWFGLYCSP